MPDDKEITGGFFGSGIGSTIYWPWETPKGAGFQFGIGGATPDMYVPPSGSPSTAGGLPVPSYEQLLTAGVTDQAKFAIIKQYYPNMVSDWLQRAASEGGGANYFARKEVVAITPNGYLYQLPGGVYIDDTGAVINPELAQAYINEDLGVQPSVPNPIVDQGGKQVSPNYYQMPDGTYASLDQNGNIVPVDEAVVEADKQEAGIGADQDVDYWTTYTDPVTGEISEVAYVYGTDGTPQEVFRRSTGTYDFSGTGGAPITQYQQAELDLAQQQLEYQQQQSAAQLAFQQQQAAQEAEWRRQEQEQEQRNYLADLMANPASWLEYAAAAGTSPIVQPWMWGLLPEDLRQGYEVGQPIPGWQGVGGGQGGGQAGMWGGGGQQQVPSSGGAGQSTYTSPGAGWMQTGPQKSVQTGGLDYGTNEKEGVTLLNAKYNELLNQMSEQAAGGAYMSPEWFNNISMQQKADLQDYATYQARLWYEQEYGEEFPVYPAAEAGQAVPSGGIISYSPATSSSAAAEPSATTQPAPVVEEAPPIEEPPKRITSKLNKMNVPSFARGGVVNRPTLAMVGENGPEAIIPISPSQNVPNQQSVPRNTAQQPNTQAGLWGLQQLTRPSRQYEARMGPTALAQYYGYEKARTGAPYEQTQWNLWSMAPPSGRQGLYFRR